MATHGPLQRTPARPAARGAAGAIVLALAFASAGGCASHADDLRHGPPAMRAVFPGASEATTTCLAEAWASVQIPRLGGAMDTTSWRLAGRGTIEVVLPQAGRVAWLVDVSRSGEGAQAIAWSRPLTRPDSQPVFAAVMRSAVERCGGEVIEDRFERDARRRLAAR